MKHTLFFALQVVLLAMMGFLTVPAQATNSNGPYYATPSWDQQLQCDAQATCPRFIVLSNWIDASRPSGGAAVLDRETGLVWEQSPSTSTFPWSSTSTTTAAQHCNRLTVGNRKGWRLPTIQELASLIDPTVPSPGPTLPAGHPFSNVQQDVYWSATTGATSTGVAWYVNFFDGGVFNIDKSISLFAWCVRGGQGVDPQ